MNKVLENSHNTRQALNTLERGYLTLLRLTFEHIPFNGSVLKECGAIRLC
ncbi:MAG: hypothetical protein KBD30_01645 [Legionellaceae bacterium]|nr:hypothetical protein [Legionellaceae bacterium]